METYAIVHLAELLNLFIAFRVLLLELVAGETDDNESLVLILLIQFLQSCELRGESTLEEKKKKPPEKDLLREELTGASNGLGVSGEE